MITKWFRINYQRPENQILLVGRYFSPYFSKTINHHWEVLYEIWFILFSWSFQLWSRFYTCLKYFSRRFFSRVLSRLCLLLATTRSMSGGSDGNLTDTGEKHLRRSTEFHQINRPTGKSYEVVCANLVCFDRSFSSVFDISLSVFWSEWFLLTGCN